MIKNKKKFFLIFGIVIYLAYGQIIHSLMVREQHSYQLIENKTIIITGACSGIGLEAARQFAKLQANVIFACKDEQQALEVIQEIKVETQNENLYFIYLDLELPLTISQFAEEVKQKHKFIDVLINNAGIADYDITLVNNVDKIFQVNQIGWVSLTNELLDNFNQEGRIINIVSHMYTWVKEKIDITQALKGKLPYRYAISQYCKVSSSLYLQNLLKENNKQIKVALIAPGAVKTNIFEKSLQDHYFYIFFVKLFKFIMHPFFLSPVEASQTYLYAALQPYSELVEGGFYNFGRLGKIDQKISEFNQGQDIYETSLLINKETFDQYKIIQTKKLSYKRLELNNKTCWPECVGKKYQDAIKIIKASFPTANCQVLPEGSPVTKDYRIDRVRIFHNQQGIVTSVPCIG